MSTHLSPTRPRALAAALLLACAAIPLLPLLGANGWPHCHEGARYFFLAESFKTVFDAGVLYPRWLPDLAGGYGYPTFVFYQPAFFFLTLPFFALFESTLMGMGAVIATLTFAGALGMYRLSRILAGRGVSLLSSALFMLSPYVFVNVYVRGDLSEFMAMMLAPWTLFFALRLRTTTQDRTFRRCGLTFGLALSLVGVVTSHPVIAMFCFPLAFAFALWLLIAEKAPACRSVWTSAPGSAWAFCSARLTGSRFSRCKESWRLSGPLRRITGPQGTLLSHGSFFPAHGISWARSPRPRKRCPCS